MLFFFFICPGSEKWPGYVITARKKLILAVNGIAIAAAFVQSIPLFQLVLRGNSPDRSDQQEKLNVFLHDSQLIVVPQKVNRLAARLRAVFTSPYFAITAPIQSGREKLI
ncbi:hypothetical protein YM80_004957 [Salmonella enterica subsp. salamae]|nr:hypothetical protein [Salmonella enterica subsp. salamae]